MSRKVFLISFLLTVALTVLASPLYLHHGFWQNWNEKRAYIEFFNQGGDHNSLILNKASKTVKVTYPANLKNVSDIEHSGQGMLMSFKVGLNYRQHYIVFESVGNGRLVINFPPKNENDPRLKEIKTGQIDFRKIFLGAQKIKAENGFVQDLRDGDNISLIFEAKKHFDFWELCQHIDWLMFIIAASLNFFIVFLVVRYLSGLKTIKKASRIDIVFLSAFFVFLVLPLSRISDDAVSEQENRVFSPHPTFFGDETFNYEYGKQFEQWFNDRFFGRDFFIHFYNKVQNIIGGKGNKKVLVGQKNWLYIADSSVVSMYQNMNLFSEKELKIVGEKMHEFVEKAKQNGVKNVYFYLSPDKETLYPEFYPTYISKQGEISRLQQLRVFMKENYPDLNVWNFTSDLEKIKNKGELMFCKTGSHMTGVGSFYEYKFFMKALQNDYPKVKILSETDEYEAFDCDTDLYRMLNDKNYSKNNALNRSVRIKYPSAGIVDNHLRFNQSLGDVTLYKNKKANNQLKVLFVSDSFGVKWLPYLAESFASVYNIFNAQGADYTFFEDEVDYLKQYKPDIIIIESAERFLQRFLNLEFPEL